MVDDNSDNKIKKNRDKSAYAFKTISEVARILNVPQHVLRFWETKFSQIKPMKRAGGRRYYRPQDIDLLLVIRKLLHAEGYTIRGVQKLIREKGIKTVLLENDKAELINNNESEDISNADIIKNNHISNKLNNNNKLSSLVNIKNQLLNIRDELIKAVK